MFDLLKKKLADFSKKLSGKIEEKAEIVEQKKEEQELEELTEEEKEALEEIGQEDLGKHSIQEKEIEESRSLSDESIEIKIEEPSIKVSFEERKPELKIGAAKKISSILSREITLTEKDVTGFLEELELSLLEADVEQETAEKIVKEIRKEIVGKKIEKRLDINQFVKQEIKKILAEIMKTNEINFLKETGKKKPFIVLVLGPNGAGKTTSIAKLCHLLQKHKKSVILSASDTFRAASIEQLEKHSKALGTRMVKHNYGADPTAVAFDAVEAAKANNIDVVLIDSAGRQDTNKNLLNELKKMERVIKPDLKIFVAEAFAGNALIEQATQFNEWVGIDGFILTKIDTDAKGGTAISLLYKLKKPILFVGTGQKYEDLIEFHSSFIIDRIV